MNKFCRICWNSESWRQPTGEAAELENSGYVTDFGFGHEEWIFNFAWLQSGPGGMKGKFRYGYLQPIHLYTFYGQTFDVFLYTREPGGKHLAVAHIKNVYVPLDNEIERAYAIMRKEGWLDEMKEDVRRLGFSAAPLDGPPQSVINVRFQMRDVHFFEPRYVIPEDHVSYRNPRYIALNWTKENTPHIGEQSRRPPKSGNKRSEFDRTRAAVKSIKYSPLHVKLQNELNDYLAKLYGSCAVRYEEGWVDLQLHREENVTYFEIKTATSAKQCIREAIGQLLEYSNYPNKKLATTLVVVGQEEALEEDDQYILHLRAKYRIPIQYMRWNWDDRKLEGKL